MFKNFIRLIIGAVGIKVAGAAFTFLLTLLISRNMDKVAAGATFIFITMFFIASTLGRFGLGNVLLRYTAVTKTLDLRLSVKVALLCSAVSGLAATACLVVLSATDIGNSAGLGDVSLALFGASTFAALTVIGAFALRGFGDTWMSVWMQSGAIQFGVCVICAFLWLAGYQLDVGTVATAFFVSSLVSFAWLVFGSRLTRCLRNNKTHDAMTMRRLLSEGWPLAILDATQLATQWIPVLLLAVFASLEAVADYHVSSRIAFLAHFMLFGVTTVVSPRFAKLHSTGDSVELARLFRWACRVSLAVGGIPLTVLILFPAPVLGVFGEGYSGTQVLQILAVGQIINMCCGPVMNLLMMTGLRKEARDAGGLGALLALGISVALAPSLGAVGVALGVTVSIITQNMMALYWARRKIGVTLFAPLEPGLPR